MWKAASGRFSEMKVGEGFMRNDEPVILNPGWGEDEILKWMRGKISSVAQLEAAHQLKETLLSELRLVDQRISELTQASSLEILPKD